LLYILKNLKVREVWTNHDATQEKGYQEFIEIIEKKNILHLKSGNLPPKKKINGATVEVLYPPPDYMNQKETWRKKLNNNSLVVKITFGETSFLFPGDIEADAEAELVRMAGDKLKSTFLIAPHHGSKTSSTEAFLDKVRPEYVIISAGYMNQFNLPNLSVLERYKKKDYKIYRTDLNGAIYITTDGKSFEIEAYRFSENEFAKAATRR
jgi:competence protein ComEC